MRTHQEIFEALGAPFPDNEVRYRPKGGRQLAYITARMARRRLNEVLGPFQWNCKIEPAEHWVLCTITATLDDGHVVVRTAMGGYPDMPDVEDKVKGGDSDAFKRCCALYGIAEYLYDDVDHSQSGGGSVGSRPQAPSSRPPGGGFQQAPRGGPGSQDMRAPTTGSGLYAWVLRVEEKKELAPKTIVKLIDEYFGPNSSYNHPRLWKEWSQDQVAAAVSWVQAKVLAIPDPQQQSEEDRPPY